MGVFFKGYLLRSLALAAQPSPEEALKIAASSFAGDESGTKQKIILEKAILGYYGYHEAGKDTKTFVPAWCFNMKKGMTLKSFCVNAQTNELLDVDNDMRKSEQIILRGTN